MDGQTDFNSIVRGVGLWRRNVGIASIGISERRNSDRRNCDTEPAVTNSFIYGHYPTLAPPGGLTLHIEKLLNSSFSINLLCLKDLAPFSYIYPTKEPSLNQ